MRIFGKISTDLKSASNSAFVTHCLFYTKITRKLKSHKTAQKIKKTSKYVLKSLHPSAESQHFPCCCFCSCMVDDMCVCGEPNFFAASLQLVLSLIFCDCSYRQGLYQAAILIGCCTAATSKGECLDVSLS